MTPQDSITAWRKLLETTSKKFLPRSDGHACAQDGMSIECGHGSIIGEGAHISNRIYKELAIREHIANFVF